MLKYLPPVVRGKIEQMGGFARVGEIHLRAGRRASVTVDGKNHMLDYCASRDELDGILHAVCGGSIYAHRDSIRAGYVTLPGGVRVGLAGRAVTEGDEVVAVTALTALCFRIPHRACGVADEMYRIWHDAGGNGGILVLAPPACGKTTFLREFVIKASSGETARRVAVVDTREELCMTEEGDLVTVLRGYPRAAGLEIALRTLSPEVLVCDEIGAGDIVAVREILHGGAPLVVAVHGSSLTNIMHRQGMETLIKSGVFSYAITLYGAAGGWQSEICELPC